MKINRLELFTDEAFSFSMPNFNVWKQHIENIILIEESNSKFNLDTTPEQECNVKASRTAWNSHERYPAVNNLCEEIKKILKKFIEEEGYDIPLLHTDECWINWYTKNQHAVPHSHRPFLAVVLFVDVEESSADFLFHSSKNFVLSKIKDNEVIKTNTLKKINVKNGTVVFFDGAIPHSVSSNLSDKRRITLAMNLRPQYLLKRDEYK